MNVKLVRPVTAEFVATALFVFLGAGSVVMNAAGGGSLGGLGVAFAHGLAIALLVSVTLNISGGHLNPAVTLGLFAARKVDGRTAGAYVAAQLLGGILGAALVKALYPPMAAGVTNVGLPALAGTVPFLKGVWLEALLTFIVVSAVFGTIVSTEAPRIAGLGVGLAVFLGALVAGPLTGAALNPARAFGPAIVAWEFHAQAVYWIGPLLGGLVAAALWKGILLPRQ